MPYFDHNATTPLTPIAREAWLHAVDEAWQNPSSLHREGARVRLRLEAARERLADYLGTKAARVIFNSGATEGANAVLAHWARAWPQTTRIAVSAIEHPCVLEAAGAHFAGRIVWLPVSDDGVVRSDAAGAALAAGGVGGVVVMAANNETGALQPWREIAALCRRSRVEFFCDASQWLGKLPGSGLGEADWVIGSAHKFGGPKGVGFLQRAEQADGFTGVLGGGQERGHRGGTENFPGVGAMVATLVEAEQKKMFLETERLRWRQEFEQGVVAASGGAVRVVAEGAERLWNTVSLAMSAGENHRWVAKLDKRGFQVSTGSACATGAQGPSHVLAAMGVAPESATRVVRASAGWETTQDDWRALARAIGEVSKEMAPAEGVVRL